MGLMALGLVALGLGWWSSLPSVRSAQRFRELGPLSASSSDGPMPHVVAQQTLVEPGESRPSVSSSVPASADSDGASSGAIASTKFSASDEPTPQDYIDEVRSQPRDDAWAAPMERTLSQDLKEKANKLGFRLGLIECFRDSCTVEAFWNTLREGRADFKVALGEPDHSRCSPRLLLSRDGNEDAPEMGVFVFDCKVSREHSAVAAQEQH
jgi:hypothetical protein